MDIFSISHAAYQNNKREEAPFGSLLIYQAFLDSLIVFLLAEVALQQTLESTAVAGLVAGHLVHGVRRFATGMLYLIYIFEASSVQVLYFSITSF